jgi:hypothetical protein
MRFCAPSAFPRSQQQHHWSGLPHPAACALRFSQPLDAFRSTASLPALFRAGSALGIAPFRAFLLPRGRTPLSGADPLLVFRPCSNPSRPPRRSRRPKPPRTTEQPLPALQSRSSFDRPLPLNPLASRSSPGVRRALRCAKVRRPCRTIELPADAAPEGSVRRTSARSARNPKILGGTDTPLACAATRRSVAWFERLHSLPVETEVPSGKHGGRNPERSEPKLPAHRTSPPSRRDPERSFALNDSAFLVAVRRPRRLQRAPHLPPSKQKLR